MNCPSRLAQRMIGQWGDPPGEAYVHDGAIALAGLDLGNVFLALQPPRGYGLDPSAIYHQPDLPPTHNYYALYRWLRDCLACRRDRARRQARHVGMAARQGAGPFGRLFSRQLPATICPLFYPFIVNNPGEGAQAKRRAHAVVVDHLIPPMTTADAYGELAELMQLVDEYYQVEMLDPQKLPLLQQQIWDLIKQAHLDEDLKHLMRQDHGDHVHDWDETMTPEGTPIGLASMQGRDVAHLIEDLDGYLCELAGAQIRDGLHVLGQAPQGEQLVGLLEALTRVPNLEVPSLRAGVARRFGLELESRCWPTRGQRLPSIPDELVAAGRSTARHLRRRARGDRRTGAAPACPARGPSSSIPTPSQRRSPRLSARRQRQGGRIDPARNARFRLPPAGADAAANGG